MKKILLSLIALIALVSCSGQKDDTKVLKVAMDLKFPPFMYVDDENNPAGLEVEVAKAFASYMDMDLQIVNTDFSMLIPALETGEVDIVISDMTVTDQRKNKVDFSSPYRYARIIALVNKAYYNDMNISDDMDVEDFFSLEDIKPIGLASTISTSIPNEYGVEATEVTEIGSAIMEINTGLSNVLVGTSTVIQDHYANESTTELYFGIPQYFSSAFAIKKGNQDLVDKANEFIETLYEEDGLYNLIKDEYDVIISDYLKDKNLGLDYIVQNPER
ncbi:MAG: transporter substrate-binding domain-containing protein [Sphaerochaetaceae bacterium]|nr:transporter substrate-binding domain-containing protein [Sphaerochaetaceae bacterium]MDC7249934.1 transporter substrate-binding domain-containing protein [Sphaerochaetaceae bacterium]